MKVHVQLRQHGAVENKGKWPVEIMAYFEISHFWDVSPIAGMLLSVVPSLQGGTTFWARLTTDKYAHFG